MSFGELVRVFRNSAFVHPAYSDADLDRVYESVDMMDPDNQNRFQELLLRLYVAIKDLAVSIAQATGRPLDDFGLRSIDTHFS